MGSTDRLYVVNAALNDGDLEPTMAAFSVDVFHRSVVEAFVNPSAAFPKGLHQKWLGAKADLALLAIVCSGNDYLPGIRGISLQGSGGLWDRYKKLRGSEQWGARWGRRMALLGPACSSNKRWSPKPGWFQIPQTAATLPVSLLPWAARAAGPWWWWGRRAACSWTPPCWPSCSRASQAGASPRRSCRWAAVGLGHPACCKGRPPA